MMHYILQARRTCSTGFACAHVVMIHKHHHEAVAGKGGKLVAKSYKSDVARKGVCGCSTRYYLNQYKGGGWRNDTCSNTTIHELMWPPLKS